MRHSKSILLLISLSLIGVFTLYLALVPVDGCIRTFCGPIVSKCQLLGSCRCQAKPNATCFKECSHCLKNKYDECCSCVEISKHLVSQDPKQYYDFLVPGDGEDDVNDDDPDDDDDDDDSDRIPVVNEPDDNDGEMDKQEPGPSPVLHLYAAVGTLVLADFIFSLFRKRVQSTNTINLSEAEDVLSQTRKHYLGKESERNDLSDKFDRIQAEIFQNSLLETKDFDVETESITAMIDTIKRKSKITKQETLELKEEIHKIATGQENSANRRKLIEKELSLKNTKILSKEAQLIEIQSTLQHSKEVDPKEFQDLLNQIRMLSLENRRLTEKIVDDNSGISRVKSSIDKLEKSNVEIMNDLSKLRQAKNELSTLKTTNETLSKILSAGETAPGAVMDTCNEYNNKIDDLRSSVSQREAELSECDTCAESLRLKSNQLERLRADLSSKRSKLLDEVRDVTQALSVEKEMFDSKHKILTEKLTALKDRKEAHDEKVKRTTELLVQAEVENAQLIKDNNLLNSQFDSNELAVKYNECVRQAEANSYHEKTYKKKVEHIQKEISLLRRRLGQIDESDYLNSSSFVDDNGMYDHNNSSAYLPPPLPATAPPIPMTLSLNQSMDYQNHHQYQQSPYYDHQQQQDEHQNYNYDSLNNTV